MYDYLTSGNVDRLDSATLNYFGKKVTHRQMQEKIDACARALTAYGVRAGDAVSLCVLAMPEAVYLLYAINKIGAIANMLVMNATEAEIHEKLAVTESKVVITVDLALEKIVQASKETSVKHIVIAYTGGTTGKAKGVLLSNCAANAIAFQYKYADKVLDFQNGECFLDIIPPFLAYGLFLGVHMALCTCLEDVLCQDGCLWW